jgi:hypothetical protein
MPLQDGSQRSHLVSSPFARRLDLKGLTQVGISEKGGGDRGHGCHRPSIYNRGRGAEPDIPRTVNGNDHASLESSGMTPAPENLVR